MLFQIKAMIVFFLCAAMSLTAQEKPMVLVTGGDYVPLYGTIDKKPVSITAFEIDAYPVTNQEFLSFLKKNPQFLRSSIKRLFADTSYLSHWDSDTDFGNLKPNGPVTNVSWFVAKEYCKCQDKRLPGLDEWEYVAMADTQKPDARTDEAYTKFILSWYEKPNTWKNSVGQTFRNYWGVFDMHGLVWEWTYDFNSIFLSGESRKNTEQDTVLFCGSSSLNSTDLMNYAAFMRYAFRASLKANYTTKNLGFRCARDTTLKAKK